MLKSRKRTKKNILVLTAAKNDIAWGIIGRDRRVQIWKNKIKKLNRPNLQVYWRQWRCFVGLFGTKFWKGKRMPGRKHEDDFFILCESDCKKSKSGEDTVITVVSLTCAVNAHYNLFCWLWHCLYCFDDIFLHFRRLCSPLSPSRPVAVCWKWPWENWSPWPCPLLRGTLTAPPSLRFDHPLASCMSPICSQIWESCWHECTEMAS